MATKTEIAQLALFRIGNKQTLTDVDTDDTAEAITVRTIWNHERDFTLRDFEWQFARKYNSGLDLAAGSIDAPANADWIFAYRYPTDCAYLRRILTCAGRQECSPPTFLIGRDPVYADAAAWSAVTAYSTGNIVRHESVVYVAVAPSTNQEPPNTSFWTPADPRLIFTNQEDAGAEYTVEVTDPGEFDGVFVSMLAWRLAAVLARAIARDRELAKECLEMYAVERGSAMTKSASEGEYAIPSGDANPRVRDLFNLALTRIGIALNAVTVDPELSFTALWPRVCFHDERNFVLRDFPWAWATKYSTLELIMGTSSEPVNDDWVYAYRHPSDCLFARRLVTPNGRREMKPPAFTLGRDFRFDNEDEDLTMTLSTGAGWTTSDTITITASEDFFLDTEVGNIIELTDGTDTVQITITGYTSATVVSGTPNIEVPAALRSVALDTWARIYDGRLIYTDQEDAVLEQTVEVTDPDEFDAMFFSMLAWRIGALLAPSIAQTKNNPDIVKWCEQNYQLEKSRAQRADRNEGEDEDPPEAEWIRGR